jgi:kynurenine 3-monooxygenase
MAYRWQDGSFTCTLFAPSLVFERLEVAPDQVPAFFDHHFPGVTSLIDSPELISQFQQNPHLPLISVKCRPYHYGSSAVILGDAAHAMVPFYGQGMNAGLEDVRILFGILDKYKRINEGEVGTFSILAAGQRKSALAEYSAVRAADAHAINDLALQNYVEMRASVLSPLYRLRKFLEESISVYLPSLGWQTRYARISFGNERYSEVVARTDHQGRMLVRGFMGVVALPLVAGGALFYIKYRKAAQNELQDLLRWLGQLMGK